MTSRAKISSNRKNAKSSTGPSEKSRAWTRYNAVTHGLRSSDIAVAGGGSSSSLMHCEKPGSTSSSLAILLKTSWSPTSSMRSGCIAGPIEHCFEHLKARIEEAGAREEQGVAGDVRRLFSDVRGPHSMYCTSSACCGGPYTSSPTGNNENPDEPSMLVARLESSEKGCLALIGHWQMLRDRLERGLEWQPQDRLKGIRMLGRQPIEVVEDERVLRIYIASFGLHPVGKKHPLEDLKCEMETPDLDAFLDRAQSRWPLILDASDTPKAKQALFDQVDESLKRLEAKVLVYRGLAAELAASRARRLAGDGSPEGERLKRYELANERRTKRCLDAFYKHRREMGGGGGGRRAEGGGRRRRAERTEGGGRRTEEMGEDGGRRAEDGGDGSRRKTPLIPGPNWGLPEANRSSKTKT